MCYIEVTSCAAGCGLYDLNKGLSALYSISTRASEREKERRRWRKQRKLLFNLDGIDVLCCKFAKHFPMKHNNNGVAEENIIVNLVARIDTMVGGV